MASVTPAGTVHVCAAPVNSNSNVTGGTVPACTKGAFAVGMTGSATATATDSPSNHFRRRIPRRSITAPSCPTSS